MIFLSTILFYPKADSCENGCLYCFEDPSFRKNNPSVFKKYDKYKMAETVRKLVEESKERKESVRVILHGGEVFSLPNEDLEFFLSEMLKYGQNSSIQSSLGVPLTSEHIRLLKTYRTILGISVDGPPEYNILRGPRTEEANKKFQETVSDNIQKLKDNDIKFGCITILSRANATPDKIDNLISWCAKNTKGGRFNPLFVPAFSKNSEITKYALTPKELTDVFRKLLDATINYPSFDFRLIEEIKSALVGEPKSTCIFNRCDYITTICKTVLPDGNLARCDRCFQDGYYYASKESANIRWKALRETECKGCRYFVACAGGCPSEGKNGDFRSKTTYCEAYFSMFQSVENILRKLFPGIFLSIDIHNYYEDYVLPQKRFNYLVRSDWVFGDTKERMVNNLRLLGWTPENEKLDKKTKRDKHGFSHMDSCTGGCHDRSR